MASHCWGSLATGNQVHQGNQADGAGSHDGGNSQVQESERSTAGDGNVNLGVISRYNRVLQLSMMVRMHLGVMVPWVCLLLLPVFDAAKDIMEALRSKHTSLAVNWR